MSPAQMTWPILNMGKYIAIIIVSRHINEAAKASTETTNAVFIYEILADNVANRYQQANKPKIGNNQPQA